MGYEEVEMYHCLPMHRRFLFTWLALLVALAATGQTHPKVEWALEQGLAPQPQAWDSPGLLCIVEAASPAEGLISTVQGLGGRVEGAYGPLVKVRLPASALPTVAELKEVLYIRRPHAPVPLDAPRLVSEGVMLLGASAFHARGLAGQGVKVAILDVGFSSLTQAQRVGEIRPEAIRWTRDYTGQGLEGGNAHGTGVAQIVHNMAPQAELFLARIGDEIDLGRAVDDLLCEGVDVIVHSLGWVNTEFGDGTGVVSAIARKASEAGVLWVNAAGNHAQRHWAGVPRVRGDGWVEFEPGRLDLELAVEIPGLVQIALTWDEWPRARSDFDLYLLDAQGWVVASSQSRQEGTAPPAEFVSHVAEQGRYTVRVRAVRASAPVAIRIFSLNHDLRPFVPEGSIMTPGTVAEVVTVGAVGVEAWNRGPQRPYSSQGPTADGRLKPDLMGPDGVTNFAYVRFAGTSAAAPHVAGMAALILAQARRQGQALGLEELKQALLRWAVDLGEPGPDPVFGYGALRVYVDQPWAERHVLTPTVAPGQAVTVEVRVRMPAGQVGTLELRENLPAGLGGRIVDRGGADEIAEGRELVWRWHALTPGAQRTVRYQFTVPGDWPPGVYTLSGTVNGVPVRGESEGRVEQPDPPEQVRLTAWPNPARAGETVRFSLSDADGAEIRLRVYDLSGRLVYDSGWQPGPTYQWNLHDGQGRWVAAGVYLCWAEVRQAGRGVRTGVERLLVIK